MPEPRSKSFMRTPPCRSVENVNSPPEQTTGDTPVIWRTAPEEIRQKRRKNGNRRGPRSKNRDGAGAGKRRKRSGKGLTWAVEGMLLNVLLSIISRPSYDLRTVVSTLVM